MKQVQLKNILRGFMVYFTVGFVILFFTLYWRTQLLELSNLYDSSQFEAYRKYGFQLIFGLSLYISLMLATFAGLIDVFILKRFLYKKSFGFVIIFSTILILLGIVFIIYFTNHAVHYILFGGESSAYETLFQIPDIEMLIITMFFIISISSFILEVDQKLGKGNLWKLLRGKFHNPREERRIFMFIDLNSSTTIAERIGHHLFSRLIQDCFNDLSVIENYHAEVYQYVGDEVVVSWEPEKGLKNNNYIKAFYAFKQELNKKKKYYYSRYGVVPVFKAGANIGVCTATEVGQLKREICYHGDTLNAASRIEELCNFYNAELLISEFLEKETELSSEYTLKERGCVELKGRQEKLRLFDVVEN